MKLPRPVLVLAAALWALAVSTLPAANTTVHVGPNNTLTFSPKNITINVGDTVIWTVDTGFHTTTSDDGTTWDSGTIGNSPGLSVTFVHTFNTAGTFPYHCDFHASSGMVGSVTVNSVVPAVPALASFVVTPASVTGGVNASGTATLTAPAPEGGIVIGVSTGTGDDIVVPVGVLNILEGDTTGNITFETSNPGGSTPFVANISAMYNGTIKLAHLTVLPPSGLASFTVIPSSVIAGQNATATVMLASPAPTGGANVTLSSNSTNVTLVTSKLKVAAGSSSANTTVKTVAKPAAYSANLTATYQSDTKTANLKVTVPALSGIQVSPGTVVGGAGANATVTLTGNATANTMVTLHSNDSSATLPASVTVSKGKSSAIVAIKTKAVPAETMPLISATYSGVTKATMLMVEPDLIQSIEVAPSTIVGGQGANGTVTLSAAPPAAITVSLSSSNTTVKVPRTVSVAKGKTSATFKITTSKTTTVIHATVTASYLSSAANTTLTIDPAAK